MARKQSSRGTREAKSAREAAAIAIARAAEHFPDLFPIPPHIPGSLSDADARLALAIHRLTLQRWLTLRHVLGRFLKKPLNRLEPAMQAVLLTGAAQLLFMHRLPDYAVVDEAVQLARRMVRPGASGMVNAVLRRLAAMVESCDPEGSFAPSRRTLPLAPGVVTLKEDLLPDPADFAAFVSVLTSHPTALVKRWQAQFGEKKAMELCLHGLENAPTILALDGPVPETLSEDLEAHQMPGFAVWQGGHAALVDVLAANPGWRVQDPASSLAVGATADLFISSALDLCAGRGTKTGQLAALHQHARIVATDADQSRLIDLEQAAAKHPNVEVVRPDALGEAKFDLLLLDVPCSNTGVLARRPEARYRYSNKHLQSVSALQKQIITEHLPRVRPGGWVLYSTCSLEEVEDQRQAKRVAKLCGGEVVSSHLELPAGRESSYHDGSFHALIRLPG